MVVAARRRLEAELDRRQLGHDVTAWAERHFYIEDTEAPIVLAPHQKAVLRYCLTRNAQGRLPFKTVIWSEPKKGGKTTVAGLVARWAAESWGRYGEILCVGNDVDQARERGFAKLKQSIELTPGYKRAKDTLPGRWKLTAKEAVCLLTGTRVKAVATDYQGEAGANPTLSVWTELWGFIHKADLRFWGEMAPSPTRPDSIRWVESYAGFEGESELLYNLYRSAVLNGHHMTAGELGDLSAFQESPNADSPVPCYVNAPASIFAYWDEGDGAHRQPWQQGDHGAQYYASEAATQTPPQYTRIHLNRWVSAESSFIEIEWWDSCPKTTGPLLPGNRTPVILALDAAVSGDCFGLVGITRIGQQAPEEPVDIAVRFVRKWAPPPGGSIDFAGPEAAVRELCTAFNVVEVAYDPYQLHDLATRLQKDHVAWFRPFSQGEERLRADKGLYDMIVHRRIHHDGHPDLREHLTNANAKQQPNEDSKLRLVKKAESRKVDLAVCLSMANAECQRLNL